MSASTNCSYHDAKSRFEDKLEDAMDFFDDPNFNEWLLLEGRDIASIVFYVLLDEEDRGLLFH